MSGGARDADGRITGQFRKAASVSDTGPRKTRRKTRKSASPVTLRVTPEERARLEERAAGMTLSAYVRGCVFGTEAKRRKRRPRDVIADKAAAAEALTLLGQSRIASNLNQLAYHANIGALIAGEAEKAQIAEANTHLKAIRALLMQALGKTSALRRAEEATSAVPRSARSHQVPEKARPSRKRGT